MVMFYDLTDSKVCIILISFQFTKHIAHKTIDGGTLSFDMLKVSKNMGTFYTMIKTVSIFGKINDFESHIPLQQSLLFYYMHLYTQDLRILIKLSTIQENYNLSVNKGFYPRNQWGECNVDLSLNLLVLMND